MPKNTFLYYDCQFLISNLLTQSVKSIEIFSIPVQQEDLQLGINKILFTFNIRMLNMLVTTDKMKENREVLAFDRLLQIAFCNNHQMKVRRFDTSYKVPTTKFQNDFAQIHKSHFNKFDDVKRKFN